MASSSNPYDVNVTFNPAPIGDERAFGYTGDQVKYEDERLFLYPGIWIRNGDTATINFNLLTGNSPPGSAAKFSASPVEWTASAAPPNTTVSEVSPQAPQTFCMVVTNEANVREKYGFRLKVTYGEGDQEYTSPDPSIINEPPGSGSS